MDTAKGIGRRLKEARKNAGYTQADVAKIFNIKQQAYARYESGTIELNYDKLIYLCQLYDVSADYILGIEDEAGRKVKNVQDREVFIYEDGTHKITHKK